MNSTIKIFSLLLVGAACAGTTLRADDKPAPKAADLFPDQVLIKGKGVEVKRSDLDEAVANVRADAMAAGQEIPPERMGMVEIKLLDHLTQVQLLKAKATDADRAKSKVEADRRTEIIRKQFPTDDALNLQLKSRSMNSGQFFARLKDEALFETMLHSKTTVTDDQAKKFYEDNPAQFEEPEMVRASHIMIRTKDKSGADLSDEEKKSKKKQIDDLLKRARSGEDFGKLAKEFSEDPGSKDQGGEYQFARGRLGLPEFEAAAFSLGTNQISDVVTTAYGYHIIKLSEKIPAHKIEFSKVAADVRNYLEKQQIEKLLPAFYADLKKEAGVEFLDEKYKAIEEEVAAQALKGAAQSEPVKGAPQPTGKN